MKELGKFLRTQRKLKGFTLSEVQNLIVVSNAYVSKIETGKILKPSADILQRLADLYQIDINYMMSHLEHEEATQAHVSEWSRQLLKSLSNFNTTQKLELLEFAKYQSYKDCE